ncbi:hypothetical protein EGW08_008468 [Elysia chlorotica]|uniref:VWFD domain-containing protein n=1 Tax=Elysia chlorotica TaxID=188477 RepID=A0A3S1BHH0_ELYCH|nr:hypothetical protein EGW08_008468 [Elysia chlorotica]
MFGFKPQPFHIIPQLLYLLLLVVLSECRTTNLTTSQCYPRCGLNAICSPKGACSCPLGHPLGDPGFACYSPEKSACFAFGDPQITGFHGEKSRIMFPCKITVAQFDTPMQGHHGGPIISKQPTENIERFSKADPKPNRCWVVVASTTRLSAGGQYYTESMDVKLVVNRRGAAESVWVHLEAGHVYYKKWGFPQILSTRDCETVRVDKSPVSICHAQIRGQWVISAPDCGHTEIVFRPWDVERESQPDVVGFGILTNMGYWLPTSNNICLATRLVTEFQPQSTSVWPPGEFQPQSTCLSGHQTSVLEPVHNIAYIVLMLDVKPTQLNSWGLKNRGHSDYKALGDNGGGRYVTEFQPLSTTVWPPGEFQPQSTYVWPPGEFQPQSTYVWPPGELRSPNLNQHMSAHLVSPKLNQHLSGHQVSSKLNQHLSGHQVCSKLNQHMSGHQVRIPPIRLPPIPSRGATTRPSLSGHDFQIPPPSPPDMDHTSILSLTLRLSSGKDHTSLTSPPPNLHQVRIPPIRLPPIPSRGATTRPSLSGHDFQIPPPSPPDMDHTSILSLTLRLSSVYSFLHSTRYGSHLFAFLLFPPVEPQPDPLCQSVTSIFNNCPTRRYVTAVNVCSPVLVKHALCATRNGHSPIAVFKTCMDGICAGHAARQLCTHAHAMISGKACPQTPALDCL